LAKSNLPPDDELDRLTAPEEEKVRCTVAHGRSVVVPHPTARRVATYDKDGNAVRVPFLMQFMPGQEVVFPPGDPNGKPLLTASEVREYRELGYLVDPDRIYREREPEGARAVQLERENPGKVGFTGASAITMSHG
jgi:hypothetical protein